ncbi:MAG TPA: DUF859 family phage minor structural protein [Casimicrobium sp.]|nr:DUF859 family phage minor structural protein [Casimicrobium sp.]
MASNSVKSPNISVIYLWIEANEASYDIATNTSVVSWRGYLKNAKYTYYYTWANDLSVEVLIDGVQQKKSYVTYDFRPSGSPREQAVVSGTSTVAHNADGTKTITATAKLNYISHAGPGRTEVSVTLPLTDIPRGVQVRTGGTWKQGLVYVRTGGVWKQGLVYARTSGAWKQGT